MEETEISLSLKLYDKKTKNAFFEFTKKLEHQVTEII